VVTPFIERTRDEDPALARELETLDATGRHELSGILGRFLVAGHDGLDGAQRLAACRILKRLRTLDADTLTVANKVLDYLDLNVDGRLSSDEMELCLQVLEVFAHAESKDGLLSLRELKTLYAVLRHLDGDDSARLEGAEIRWLRHSLADPAHFMERMRTENPHLRRILES
jgi:hypothetical protein